MTLMQYRLELQKTAASTGYFAPVPHPPVSFENGLAYLCNHSNDAFMHTHLLDRIGKLDVGAVSALFDSNPDESSVVRALIVEAILAYEHLSPIRKRFKRRELKALAEASPLIYLQSELLADQKFHRKWAALFRDNLMRHRPLPPPEKTGLAFPLEGVDGSEEAVPEGAHLKMLVHEHLTAPIQPGQLRPPLEETIERALNGLEALGLFEGGEMRHQSSLSPVALLRQWRFTHQVDCGALCYSISGTQASYGRGLSLKAARAACLMEVVERCSSFAGVTKAGITGTRRPHPVLYGQRSRIEKDGYTLLNPNCLNLEVPYRDEPLYWMEGERLTDSGFLSIWVPVQCVYLFCNLDERALFSGLGSTGLASGNTTAEARLSALYELLERDSEAINPFHPSRCFRVYSEDDQMRTLFEDYRAREIHLQFQDISPAFGIPCCSCFVTAADGTVARGGGANLNGKQAVLSGLTETPYPYPQGPPSAPAYPDLPWLRFEDLPDFSTASPEHDLRLMEKTLLRNGYQPIYVDITRRDLDIPVTRALIPGVEMMADFDSTSRISPRLFNNYLKIHKKTKVLVNN
ncbi:MAG: bacteriocin [Proteobacteria bacterium]|nr:MAG: bacteriocin [Pseudomonadota bacterium]